MMKLNIKKTIWITLILMILNIMATIILGCGVYSFWCISRESETIAIILDIIFGSMCTCFSLVIFSGLGIATSSLLED
ncbi:MAG: hypothetical protein J6R47_00275 [Acholeplasmatales bacterium]|nr:hypothetical protein [Acholeplasmatales bacterium]